MSAKCSFEDYCDHILEVIERMKKLNKTICEKLMDLLIKHEIYTGSHFSEVTLLNPTIFNKIKKNEPGSKFEVEVIVTICASLKLGPDIAEDLLKAEGMGFCPDSDIHQIYKAILRDFCNDDIFNINKVLRAFELSPLGSKSYREK